MTSDRRGWMDEFFTDADSFKLERLVAWFDDKIEVRFGNQPAQHGKAAAEQAFKEFWTLISGMRHARESMVYEDALGAQMSIVTYIRHDGSEVGIPVASHLRRSAPRQIDRLWIFIDLAPLFAGSAGH